MNQFPTSDAVKINNCENLIKNLLMIVFLQNNYKDSTKFLPRKEIFPLTTKLINLIISFKLILFIEPRARGHPFGILRSFTVFLTFLFLIVDIGKEKKRRMLPTSVFKI